MEESSYRTNCRPRAPKREPTGLQNAATPWSTIFLATDDVVQARLSDVTAATSPPMFIKYLFGAKIFLQSHWVRNPTTTALRDRLVPPQPGGLTFDSIEPVRSSPLAGHTDRDADGRVDQAQDGLQPGIDRAQHHGNHEHNRCDRRGHDVVDPVEQQHNERAGGQQQRHAGSGWTRQP